MPYSAYLIFFSMKFYLIIKNKLNIENKFWISLYISLSNDMLEEQFKLLPPPFPLPPSPKKEKHLSFAQEE